MNPTIQLKESGDDGALSFLRDAKSIIENAHVYVGIPEEETSRKVPIVAKDIPTNAGLLFIHSHGSHIRNIPARPVIEPAIENDKDGLSKYLSAAANAYLEGDIEKGNRYMTLAGIRGSNDAKRWFKDPRNGWPPNTRETIRRKLHKGLRNNPRKLKKALAQLYSGDLTGLDQTLVDYGEMKRAITFVTDLPATVPNKPKGYNEELESPDDSDNFEVENQVLEPE